ncbi:MAG: tetratricopeptide repeat protein [Phycisphaeraceae bacterium]|nr:tetratricopeptide repeat protein [Phycisphaeraceae bacterium]
MTEHPHDEVRRLFDLAMDAPPEDRGALLDRECRDARLRARILAMIAAAEDDRFLAHPTANKAPSPNGPTPSSAAATIGDAPRERPGQTIGRYKLLEQIGEGGFGSVWAAEQKEPVRRRVALKIIKLGMDTRQVIARFEAERQALAMMDHPNIAKVLDAGATETGRPYFIMELVKGVPILDYCDKEKLDTRARLDLFTKVCHAIQHAHQKGIIHRDIKPSNVLITLHDGVPVPKVIDFGIAKATNAELTSKTIYTEHRQMIGTPAYMSPEQAEMSGLDIDTRSDIYSLGVLLYELLTGTTPFATEELLSKGFAEMMRIIREEEPHKPSTRLSTLGETGTRTAQQRRTDVKKLGVILRGDLDWIVMKCLEKDRQRRYETANGLAADIQRHLCDEPVLAGPPSARYRLAKFVKRNRGQVIAGGVVAAALVLGVVGTSWGMVRAKEQAGRAQRELARANEIKSLIKDMLTSVDPAEAQGADTTLLKGILDDASARLEKGEITDQLVAAELHHVVGRVYRLLALYPQAEPHTTKASEIRTRLLGEEHPDTLASMHELGLLYAEQGRYSEAESRLKKALELRTRVLGEEHHDTLSGMTDLAWVYGEQARYDEREALDLKAVEIQKRVLGEEHRDTLTSMHDLANAYRAQRRYAEAEELFLKTMDTQKRVLGAEHPDTLVTMNSLSLVYRSQGRYAEAEALNLKALEIERRVMGATHAYTLVTMHNLALGYKDQRRYAEAEALYLETLEIERARLGDEHPGTLMTMINLAEVYARENRFAKAEQLLEKVIEGRRRVLGEEHPETQYAINTLAGVYWAHGRNADAEALYVKTLEIQRRVLGGVHEDTLATMNSLAGLYGAIGKMDKAEALLNEIIEIKRRALGSDDASTLTSVNDLELFYIKQERYAEAEPLVREVLESRRRAGGAENDGTLTEMNNLVLVLAQLGRSDEAMPVAQELVETASRMYSPDDWQVGLYLGKRGLVETRLGLHDDAASDFSRAYKVLANAQGISHVLTWRVVGYMRELQEARATGGADVGQALRAQLFELDRERMDEASARRLNEDAWWLLNLRNEADRDPERALMLAERACAGEEASGGDHLFDYLDTLALAQRMTGDASKAVETQKRALSLMPPARADRVDYERRLADAYLALGRREEAVPLYRELLGLQTAEADKPDASDFALNEAAWFLLTHEIEELRDPARALGYAERACALEEAANGASLWQYLDTLALAQHATGDTAAAIDTQRRAISLMSTPDADPEMHDRLAEYEAALAAPASGGP